MAPEQFPGPFFCGSGFPRDAGELRLVEDLPGLTEFESQISDSKFQITNLKFEI
jgi:hypothetical protein